MRPAPALRLLLASVALIAFAATERADALAAGFAKAPTRATRRVGRFTSLTGAWSGAYRYPFGFPDTPFNALLEESAGALAGTTEEPDMRGGAGKVTASLNGEREDTLVRFVKQMDGSGGMRHAIRYEGKVDPDFTRIEGTWSIPGNWSGSFFMERAGLAAEEAATRAAGAVT